MPSYNIILAAVLFICTSLLPVCAQTARIYPEPEPPRQTLFLELGGSFIFLGGINYERILWRKPGLFLALRGGLGLDLWHFSEPALAIPVGASVNIGKEHFLELGATATISVWPEKITSEIGESAQYRLHHTHEIQPLIGYRFQTDRPGFLFRATLAPILLPLCSSTTPRASCDRKTLAPWVGVSGGIAF